jgi:hypothetical protein
MNNHLVIKELVECQLEKGPEIIKKFSSFV